MSVVMTFHQYLVEREGSSGTQISACVRLRSPVDEVYMLHNLKFIPVTEIKGSVTF